MSSINILSEDTLIHLFKMLSYADLAKVRLVCKTWCKIVEYVKDHAKEKYINNLPYDMSVPLELRLLRKLMTDGNITDHDKPLSFICRLFLDYNSTIMIINGELIIKTRTRGKNTKSSTFMLKLGNIDPSFFYKLSKVYYVDNKYHMNDNFECIWIYSLENYHITLITTKTATILGYTHNNEIQEQAYDLLYDNFQNFHIMENSGITIIN